MKKKLLFLCTGNSCRSQMAEGLANIKLNDKFKIHSAGVESHGLNPRAVEVMDKIGIDISHQTSENVEDYFDRNIDIVITLSNIAQEACAIFPGKVEKIHWDVPDPFPGWTEDAQFLMKFREVRNIIRSRIDTFLMGR